MAFATAERTWLPLLLPETFHSQNIPLCQGLLQRIDRGCLSPIAPLSQIRRTPLLYLRATFVDSRAVQTNAFSSRQRNVGLSHDNTLVVSLPTQIRRGVAGIAQVLRSFRRI
jgi:hypothetical protein